MLANIPFILMLICWCPLFLIHPLVRANPISSEPDTSLHQLTIKEIEIAGNTVLHREIENLSRQLIGRSGTVPQIQADILDLLFQIDLLYQESGYIGTKAIFLPGQDLRGGIFRLAIVEGQLESIEVEGLQRLHSEYVTRRLWLSGAVPLNIEELNQSLQLLQANPLFTSVRASLEPGSTPNGRRMIVTVEEAPAMALRVDYNDYQSETVGKEQLSGLASHQNLTGNGDRLDFQGNFTEGLNQYYLDYQMPVNPRDGHLRWHLEWGGSTIVQEPLDRFDLTGNTTKIALTWNQPLWRTPQNQLNLFVSFSWQETKSFLLGEPFSFIEETADGVSTISALRFGQEFISRAPASVFVLRNQFNVGLDWFDATTTDLPSGRDSQFFSWQIQSQYSRFISQNLIFNTRLAAQVTGDALLPGELFLLGGVYTVRGYNYNIRSGDGGFAGTVELIWTPVIASDLEIRLIPFFDLGAVYNNGDVGTQQPDTLASTGLSLELNYKIFRARLDYAIPLVEVPSAQRQDFSFSIGTQVRF
jgi:hemolysin activation/secretion protein